MNLKIVLITFLALFSTQIFSDALVTELAPKSNDRIVDELRSIRRDLRRGYNSSALDKVERLLERLRDTSEEEKTYSRLGLVYKNDSRFRCDYNDQQRAKTVAENAAMDICYRDGARSCRVMSNSIIVNGYLGTIDGTYYGYGCKASVVVRGYFN